MTKVPTNWASLSALATAPNRKVFGSTPELDYANQLEQYTPEMVFGTNTSTGANNWWDNWGGKDGYLSTGMNLVGTLGGLYLGAEQRKLMEQQLEDQRKQMAFNQDLANANLSMQYNTAAQELERYKHNTGGTGYDASNLKLPDLSQYKNLKLA